MRPDNNQPWTVLALLKWTSQYLASREVESPRLAGEVLLAHCLGWKRVDLYARYDYIPTQEQLSIFRELVKQASSHKPVAYLTGQKEFYSLSFTVTADVLIPRPETETIVDEAIAHLRRRNSPGTLWDVCTGCGCIAVAVACNVPETTVLATDLSIEALKIAKLNAQAHDVGERVSIDQADLLTLPKGNWQKNSFDVITANPPYVATADKMGPETAFEPPQALLAGEDGFDFIKPLIVGSPKMLAPGAMLVMEFGQGQADQVRDLITATGAFREPRILRDHQGIERTVVAIKCP